MLTPTPLPLVNSSQPAIAARRRILIVDDETLLLRALRRLLSAYHDVIPVAGGHDALRLLDTDREFDVVLCDVQMPGMTGPQLLAALEQRWPELARRFIFMTAGTLPANVLAGRPHLQKPFLLEEALDAIEAAVPGASGSPPSDITV